MAEGNSNSEHEEHKEERNSLRKAEREHINMLMMKIQELDSSFFYIRSEMSDLVLEAYNGNAGPGTAIVTGKRVPGTAEHYQTWFLHKNTGTIRNTLNSFCMDVQDDNILVLNPYEEEKETQKWLISGNVIRQEKRPEMVVDIKWERTNVGATIISYPHHGGKNQLWKIQTVDPWARGTVLEMMKLVLNCK